MIRPRELLGKGFTYLDISEHPISSVIFWLAQFTAFFVCFNQMVMAPSMPDHSGMIPWKSPFLHVMYFMPGYWIMFGLLVFFDLISFPIHWFLTGDWK